MSYIKHCIVSCKDLTTPGQQTTAKTMVKSRCIYIYNINLNSSLVSLYWFLFSTTLHCFRKDAGRKRAGEYNVKERKKWEIERNKKRHRNLVPLYFPMNFTPFTDRSHPFFFITPFYIYFFPLSFTQFKEFSAVLCSCCCCCQWCVQ